VSFIRAADMSDGRVLFNSAQCINELARSRIRKGIGLPGDVLLSHKGTVGKVAYAPAGCPDFVCSPQTTFWRVMDERVLDRRFLFAYMQSADFKAQLASRKGETDMADYVSLTAQRQLQIPVPGILLQREIGKVFSVLNDRITLLRETNATLEAIAQALFKSWFVDFDPVRAKAEGRQPEGMDATTAALFPDSFEESKLGLVPEGWMSRPIYDMATYINGAAYKAFEPNAERRGLPIIKIAELKAGISAQTAFSDVAMPAKYLIETGDILFSWSGNPDTSIDTFVWQHAPALLNQHIFRVLPHEAFERSFVLQMLRNLKPVFAELARNKQTTGLGHVTVADLKRLCVVHPPQMVIEQFNTLVVPIHQMIFGNEQRAQTLTQLRDTLLPRLISGQLCLTEAQALLNDRDIAR
jgi:type I restriction enzyme S subunit